ncbi:6-carboxytetrahydropterin synthase QueD [Candidatus Parcubacteria bacterium]|nr:MAG: 6-carboxytetrahydropterin synthase QueD [Candidatus Parcubacteria bacterium]
MEIYKVFTFDAAHRLPNLPETHKCRRLHGHTFRVEIRVAGKEDDAYDWVIDFSDIAKIAAPIIEILDHNYLNDIEGLENPTSENIAKWIWRKLKPNLPILTQVVVQESPNSGVVCIGEDD